MNAEILRGFVEQAESSLSSIRRGILLCAREGNAFGELNSAIAQLSSIKDAALIVGCAEIAKTVANLEEKLESFVVTKEKLADEQTRRFLDEVTRLESLVTKVNFSLDDFSSDVADFVDDYFENIQIRQSEPEPEAEMADEPEEEFEIDEEMLEVFALEAEELIQGISANLKILKNSPNDREALLEVRRNAHTLKGSAGIVGLKKLSQVAHRVEDLLDYLAENDAALDDEIFGLLSAATDCFEALTNNEDSAQTTVKIAQIYESCDDILSTLKKKNCRHFPDFRSRL